MLQKFKQFPVPLQKQILIRAGFAAAFFLLTILCVIFLRDWSAILVSVLITTFCIIQSLWLFYIADNQKYIVINGICCDMTVTPIKRRVKAILLRTTVDNNEVFVRVMLRNRLKKFPPGAQMSVYVSENTLMHEKDGAQQLYGYLAVACE